MGADSGLAIIGELRKYMFNYGILFIQEIIMIVENKHISYIAMSIFMCKIYYIPCFFK